MLYSNFGGTVYVDIYDFDSGEWVCEGESGWDGDEFVARIATWCLGNPDILNIDSLLYYDSDWDNPNAPVYDDVVHAVRTAEGTPAPASARRRPATAATAAAATTAAPTSGRKQGRRPRWPVPTDS